MTIAIVGMLDEREEALLLIRDRIRERGNETCLIDISVGSGAIVPTLEPDLTAGELALLAESSAGLATARGDTATSVATAGLKAKIRDMHARGEVQGIIAITGVESVVGMISGISLGVIIAGLFIMVATVITSYTSTAYHTCLYLWARDVEKAAAAGSKAEVQAPAPLAAVLGDK